MHVVSLADLAAVVSSCASSMVSGQNPEMAFAVTPYWTATRNRLDLWHHVITRYRINEREGNTTGLRLWWNRHIVVLEEILVSDMLCRVVAVLGAAMDRERKVEDISPITDRVFQSQMEARARVHHLMLYGRGSSVRNTVRLNRLRQATERWTDALIGRMEVDEYCLNQFAVNPERALEYAEEYRESLPQRVRQTSDCLLDLAMHDTLKRRTSQAPGLPRANQRVADSVMTMFQAEMFGSFGTLKSRWLRDLQANAGTQDRDCVDLANEPKHHPIASVAWNEASAPQSQRWYQ